MGELMKRFLWIVMASITLLFCAVGCKSNEIDMHKESMNITALMEMKANNEDYWQLQWSGSKKSWEEERSYFTANDYDRPVRCYRITKPDAEKCKEKLLLRENEQEQFNNLPNELKEDLTQRYFNEQILFQLVMNSIQFSGNDHYASTCILQKQ